MAGSLLPSGTVTFLFTDIEGSTRLIDELGEESLTGEGYAGREMHRAARIAASGHGGQVVVSSATRALVEGELTELGEHRLNDFDEPVALTPRSPIERTRADAGGSRRLRARGPWLRAGRRRDRHR